MPNKLKKYFLLVGLLFVFNSTQGAVLDKKNIKTVHKIALICLYSPKRILLAEHMPDQPDWQYFDPLDEKLMVNFKEIQPWLGKEQSEKDIQSLYDFSLKTFQASLATVPIWEFVPFESIVNVPGYKTFSIEMNTAEKKAPTQNQESLPPWLRDTAKTTATTLPSADQYLVSTDMKFIPFEFVSDGSKIIFGQDPFKPQKEVLAKLCQELNVDAVAMVKMRISYRYGKLAKLMVGDSVKGIPRISSALLVVSKDGKTVIETGPVLNMVKDEFEGDSVSIAKAGKLLLDSPAVRTSYETAISASANGMKAILVKAFANVK